MWRLAITLLLAVHLVAMNLASAGPLVCVWLQLRRTRGDRFCGAVGRRLAWCSAAAMVVGIVLGLLLMVGAWLDGERAYWNALARLPTSAYLFAASELVFTFVGLAVYIACWDRWSRRPWLHGVFAILASTNLLYHFPPMMAAIRVLAGRPELVSEESVTRPLLLQVMGRPTVLAMTAHFVLASFAVAGVAVMQIACRLAETGESQTDNTDGAPLICRGACIALVPTLLQIVAGVWLLTALPPADRNSLMGGDWLATLLLAGSLLAALGLMHALAVVALGDTSAAQIRRCVGLLLLVVALMAAAMVRGRGRRSEVGGQVAVITLRLGHPDSRLLIPDSYSLPPRAVPSGSLRARRRAICRP